MNEKRIVLTKEEAIRMLPDKEEIHTFRQGSNGLLLGANWSRESIIESIRKYETELSGQTARRMGHGIAFCDEHGFVFVETEGKGGNGIENNTENN